VVQEPSIKKEQSLAATYVVDGWPPPTEGAARFLESDGLSAYYQYLVADQWARTDVLAAAAWVEQLPNSAEKQRAFDVISGRWTHANPQQRRNSRLICPWSKVPTRGRGDQPDNLLLGVIQQWAQDNASAPCLGEGAAGKRSKKTAFWR